MSDKKIEKIPKVISERDIKKIRASIDSYRNLAIFDFLLNTGLRVSELSNIKIHEVDTIEKKIKVIGKRNKERIVPLNNNVVDSLSRYLDHRAIKSDYLFCTEAGKIMSRQLLYQIIDNIGKKNKIELHPHMLRHTFGTHLLNKGVPLDQIAILLGHKNINTTTIYSKVSITNKIKATNKLNRKSIFSFFRKKEIKNFALPNQEISIIRNETKEIKNNFQKRISTIIGGGRGVGKSIEIKKLKQQKNIIFLETLQTKTDYQKLIDILDIEENLFYDIPEKEKKLKEIKKNIISIIDFLKKEKLEEYTILIDDFSLSSKTAKEYLLKLKQKLIIFLGYSKKDFLSSYFHYIEIKNLNRKETEIIINHNFTKINKYRKLQLLDIIFSRSLGNPAEIINLINIFKKNNFNFSKLSKTKYSESTNQISMGFFFLFLGFAFVIFSLKLTMSGIGIAAGVYTILIMARLIFYKIR